MSPLLHEPTAQVRDISDNHFRKTLVQTAALLHGFGVLTLAGPVWLVAPLSPEVQ